MTPSDPPLQAPVQRPASCIIPPMRFHTANSHPTYKQALGEARATPPFPTFNTFKARGPVYRRVYRRHAYTYPCDTTTFAPVPHTNVRTTHGGNMRRRLPITSYV